MQNFYLWSMFTPWFDVLTLILPLKETRNDTKMMWQTTTVSGLHQAEELVVSLP